MEFNKKDYNTVLTETANFFAANGVSIIGEGYKEIANNPALLESYIDQLTEGCSANDAATMAQIMLNTNSNILRESSMTGIQPVASLSMPVIRKLWPKFALKEAIDTEVAKTPRFVVAYTKPYMFTADTNGEEKRVYLPYGIKGLDENGNELDALSKKYVTPKGASNGKVSVANGNAVSVEFDTKVTNTPSAVKKQPCDGLVIESAVLDGKAIKIGKRLDVYGNGIYEIDGAQLIVRFDGANAKATLALVGAAEKTCEVTLKAVVSSEYNEESWSVGYDVARQDIDIPTGQHINAPLPIEALNDMMALYQIDGTKETVDLMTNVFAMKLDKEILAFIENSIVSYPANEAFSYLTSTNEDGDKYADEFFLEFDCKPAAGFAGSPKAWREELKPMIDHLAQRIKNNTYLQAGIFTIIANPLDVQLLTNVDWSFRGGQGGNVDGVNVDYSVGTFVGANSYKVVASTLVPAGAMYLIFTPSSNTQMTYKYYPYTFSTELGYVDPNRSRTPSIMMTKRHTLHEFMPAVGLIHIKNNDGKGYFSKSLDASNWAE